MLNGFNLYRERLCNRGVSIFEVVLQRIKVSQITFSVSHQFLAIPYFSLFQKGFPWWPHLARQFNAWRNDQHQWMQRVSQVNKTCKYKHIRENITWLLKIHNFFVNWYLGFVFMLNFSRLWSSLQFVFCMNGKFTISITSKNSVFFFSFSSSLWMICLGATSV